MDCYKYFPLKYLLCSIDNAKMTFMRISSWQDVYENFFINQLIYIGAERCRFDDYTNRLYGQSWTLWPESDAMWRIYSDKKSLGETAIKVKCDGDSYYRALTAIYNDGVSYGSVQYLDDEELGRWYQKMDIRSKEDFEEAIVPSLYIKRPPFEHEKEFRYIILKKSESLMLEVPLNILELFEEYVVDPRLDFDSYEAVSSMLQNAGVPKERISQSKLYSFEKRCSVFNATQSDIDLICKDIQEQI